MPSNLTKRKFKKKRRSCPMCKPHKMKWADRRKLAERRADQTLNESLSALRASPFNASPDALDD